MQVYALSESGSEKGDESDTERDVDQDENLLFGDEKIINARAKASVGAEKTMSEIWAETQEWERKKNLGISATALTAVMGASCFIVLSLIGGGKGNTSPHYFSQSLPTVRKHLDFEVDSNYCMSKFDDEFVDISEENKHLAHASLSDILAKYRFDFTTKGSSSDEMCGGRPSIWHDGFSGLVLARWEPYLAVDMLTKWFSMQSAQGQIPSHETAPLDISVPPSLVLVVRQLFQMSQVDSSAPQIIKDRAQNITSFLRETALPGLAQWYRFLDFVSTVPHSEDSTSDIECHRYPELDLSTCGAHHLTSYERNENQCDIDLHLWLAIFAATLDELCKGLPGESGKITGDACKTEDWSVLVHNAIVDAKQVFAGQRGKSLWLLLGGLDSPNPQMLQNLDMGDFASEHGIPSADGGKVSIDLNYLVLGALFHASASPKFEFTRNKIRETYSLIRERVLSTIYDNKDALYQYYDAETGEGLGEKNFVGGTSLALLIETEEYPDLALGKYLLSSVGR